MNGNVSDICYIASKAMSGSASLNRVLLKQLGRFVSGKTPSHSLSPTCWFRLQRDQAAHFHASNKQVGDELVESQAQLSQQAGRLSKEGERRRHLEALLDEGLQVQNQILLGLQVHHTCKVDLTYNTLSN